MRALRAAVLSFLALCVIAPVIPAHADVGAIVVVNRSEYFPGDDRLGPLVLPSGHELLYENLDIASFGSTHSVTSDATLADGTYLFDSGVLQAKQSITLDLTSLEPGTYGFHCSVHSDVMHGTLIVV